MPPEGLEAAGGDGVETAVGTVEGFACTGAGFGDCAGNGLGAAAGDGDREPF